MSEHTLPAAATDENNISLEDFFTEWTTVKEAANLVNRTHSTLRRWIKSNKIRCYNLGPSEVRVVNIEEVRRVSDNTPRRPSRKKQEESANA